MNTDVPFFLNAPTRSQYANKADFDVANNEYRARMRRKNEMESESFQSAEADYQKTITRD